MTDERIADLRVEMTACRVDKESRVQSLEDWKEEQNGELKQIRRKGTATLVAIILLLIGVVTNLAIDRSRPDIDAAVRVAVEDQLTPIIETVIDRVLRITTAP